MAKLSTEEKRLFVVASGSPEMAEFLSSAVNRHISNASIYTALDGLEALFKMENTPPHVLIVDWNLPKLTTIELIQQVLYHSRLGDTSIVIVAPLPDKENFVDQVVTCQVQFLTDAKDENVVSRCLTKALNRLTNDKDFSYRLRFLSPLETLFHEGDQAESVFIVKRGDLHAYKGDGDNKKILGSITSGEFVGEMAHINSEPRSATVTALTDCELIEIPMGTLDTILFSKPAWSRALVATLSRRLKRTNDNL